MGRTQPSRGLRPSTLRRDDRAKRAKETLNIDIPAILRANPRAQQGVDSSRLITDAQASKKSKHRKKSDRAVDRETSPDHEAILSASDTATPLVVKVELADTLQSAYYMHQQYRHSKIAILNMASPLRPGGGFLTGAQAQEESLCMRSTLYPSLSEAFYRLPEVGAIYTKDILVFRGWNSTMADLAKDEQFYVDVITAAMPRFPDTKIALDGSTRYADTKDRELVEVKMRKVMSILKSQKVSKVVLGAWGCGAYKNPLDEVIQLWKKVLFGGDGLSSNKNAIKQWSDMEVVFAINQNSMAEAFAEGLDVDLSRVVDRSDAREEEEDVDQDQDLTPNDEMQQKIDQLQTQISQARNPDLKARLQNVLDGLHTQQSKSSGFL